MVIMEIISYIIFGSHYKKMLKVTNIFRKMTYEKNIKIVTFYQLYIYLFIWLLNIWISI